MPKEVVGNIPEFTQEDPPVEGGEKEVKPGEGETPPETPPAGEKPAKETPPKEEPKKEVPPKEVPSEGTETEEDKVARQTEGLKTERDKLLKDIIDLRGQRREVRGKPVRGLEPEEVKVDDLKDLHPDDVKIIEKVLKAKGYVPKTEIEKTIYGQIKQEQLDKFLEKYPEFSPANDPDDKNWNALQEELKFYRMPDNPRQMNKILERARQAISSTVPLSDKGTIEAQKQRAETAGVGTGGQGGTELSSSIGSFDPDKVDSLRRGGFTDEEIIKNLTKLKEKE